MPTRLQSLTIRGFKSIEALEDFRPEPLTVLIGPNGAGKSNFISFFRFMSWMLVPPGNLQMHVAKLGGANAILHDGAARTPQCEAHIKMQSDTGLNEYKFRLFHGAGDTLVFADEAYRYSDSSKSTEPQWISLGAGQREAALIGRAEAGDKTAGFILGALRKCIVHQFHNTSDSARMKQKWDTQDNRHLKEDGANIASVLLRLRNEEPRYFGRILDSLRLVLPFLADFELQPEFGKVLLRWTERGSDITFGPDQASDGMLRVIQLWTLLLMPSQRLPAVLILDEPELGLHPLAIVQLAGMLKSASQNCQVIAATQSVQLVDEFRADDVVVIDRVERCSTFSRKSDETLRDWLEDYSLGQLWEKNILGGRPK